MSKNNDEIEKPVSNWDKMVHAPFKKVVAYNLICMGIGLVIGIGLGVFVLREVIGA